MHRGSSVHVRTAATAGLLVVLGYVLLALLAALVSPPLVDRFGAGAVGTTASGLAVVSWAAAGWFGTRALRSSGTTRRRTVASAAVGAGVGYLAVPGLLGVVGLVLVGAPLTALLAGPLLSTVLVAAVAGLAAALGRHAPAPALYAAR